MRFFGLFGQPDSSPDAVLQALDTARARQNWDEFAALCTRHSQLILEHFGGWCTAPAAVRDDPVRMDAYVQTLGAIAEMFQRNGIPDLMQRLTGDEKSNPQLRWNAEIDRAVSQMNQREYDGAIQTLTECVGDVARSGASGSGVEQTLARCQGTIGIAHFHAGRIPEARTHTATALDICSRAGDAEGVAVYSKNLRDLAESEPKLVFRGPDGAELTAAQVPRTEGRVGWEIVGGAPISPAAHDLHQRGRAAGAKGQFAEALAFFRDAAALAPEWAYPVYDSAFTCLFMGDSHAAREWFERVLERSPRGFFDTIMAADTLKREEAGDLPAGTLLAYHRMEGMPDRGEKAARARGILDPSPNFAPAWKELALALEDPEERYRAIKRGLAAGPDPDTRGVLLINQAIEMHQMGNTEAAYRQLRDLAFDPAATLNTEHGAKSVLELMSRAP